MIKFNDRFECERLTHCWHLHESKAGTGKDGNQIKTRSTTFYSDLPALCNAIIDRSCDEADNITSVIACVEKAFQEIKKALGVDRIIVEEALDH